MNYVMEIIAIISNIAIISAIMYTTYKADWPWWAAVLIVFVVPFFEYRHDPELQKTLGFHRIIPTMEAAHE